MAKVNFIILGIFSMKNDVTLRNVFYSDIETFSIQLGRHLVYILRVRMTFHRLTQRLCLTLSCTREKQPKVLTHFCRISSTDFIRWMNFCTLRQYRESAQLTWTQQLLSIFSTGHLIFCPYFLTVLSSEWFVSMLISRDLSLLLADYYSHEQTS